MSFCKKISIFTIRFKTSPMEHTTHCCKALLIAGEWPRMSAESLDYPTTTATVIE